MQLFFYFCSGLSYPILQLFSFCPDELEVEALFERELAKAYNEENPEDDMVEKVHTIIMLVVMVMLTLLLLNGYGGEMEMETLQNQI